MSKNQTYRSLVARPVMVMNLDGELLEAPSILKRLASEIRDISSYATFVVRNDAVLGERVEAVTVTQPAVAGNRAGVTMPDFLSTGRTGRSRKERLMQHNVVTSYRSLQERIKAANGESSKYIKSWMEANRKHHSAHVWGRVREPGSR